VVVAGVLLLCGCTGSGNTHSSLPEGDESADVPDTGHAPSHDDSSDSGSNAVPEQLPPAKSVMCHVDETAVAQAPAPAPAGKPGKPAPASKDAGNPPTVQQPISISPKELMWRIDEKRVAEIYGKVIDGDYKEKYQKAQIGPETIALDNEVQQAKDVFKRSLLEFGAIPTGVDASPLKGEYTYNNAETMMRITRKGKTRDFFFIQHHLWKIVDEIPLGEKEQWGASYADALIKIAGAYGIPGRICQADYEHARNHTEVDWRDAQTQVRAIEWDDKTFGLAFVDLGTLGQLASFRQNKATTTNGVDPSVQDVMHTPEAPPVKDKKDDKKK